MTDEDEDVGEGGRKRYLLQWQRGDTHSWNTPLRTDTLVQWTRTVITPHCTHTHTGIYTQRADMSAHPVGLGGACHLKGKTRQMQARSVCVTATKNSTACTNFLEIY